MADPRPSVLFLGSTYAGHATRFANLRRHAQDDPRIRPLFRAISGWNERGLLERTPLVPAGLKGRARAVFEARPMAMLPRPDVIWTSGGEELAVYAPLQRGPWRSSNRWPPTTFTARRRPAFGANSRNSKNA